MTDRTACLDRLRRRLGDRLVADDAVRDQHGHDVSHHETERPDAVAFPESNDEVAFVVATCAEHRVPVIPFGTGTAVEGGVVATTGGVSLDLSRMNRILHVGVTDMDATVQAGVTRVRLNDHLADTETGLHFPVHPGADASLGGMAATRASGTAAVRYGTMRERVLGLTVVTADGQIVRTGGRARKSSAGYDLTRLFVGSEGTLGVITEVTLKLARIPDAVSAAVCPFPDVDSAVAAAIAVMSRGVDVAKMELLDEVLMQAVGAYSGLEHDVTPTLFFEFHGSPTGVEEAARAAEAICHAGGGRGLRWATDEAERKRLWQARYDAFYAALALRANGSGYVTDVCVPISQLATCIRRTKELLAEVPFPAPLFGHVGDGNFHVVCAIDRDVEEELSAARALSEKIVTIAHEHGGTCTGEHGIGIGKLGALERECGPAIDVMRRIKRALDPHNVLNPGKVLRAD